MTGPQPMMAAALSVAANLRPAQPPAQVTVLYGDLRTGRILGELPAVACSWSQTLNAPGKVEATVTDDVIRGLDLRRTLPAAKAFLAVELDGYMQEAGPVWARAYDWETGQLRLAAAGLWSYFEHRTVLAAPLPGGVATGADLGTVTVAGTDLGGIMRALVWHAMQHPGGDLPIDLEDERPGTRTETFPGWKLYTVAQQMDEITKREERAPDGRFTPYRVAEDRRLLRWRMETGSEEAPQLSQVGADWVFDTTVPRGPVLGIGADEDATVMGSRSWLTGNGSEADVLMATAYDGALVDGGGPLLEVSESRSTVERHDTLQGHADGLAARRSAPVEKWRLSVRASAAREVRAGDYCQVVTADHPYLGSGVTRMRVQQKSGTLADRVQLDMYEMPGEAA